MEEIDRRRPIADFNQHSFASELEGSKMRAEQFEVHHGQSCQQLIGRMDRGQYALLPKWAGAQPVSATDAKGCSR
jgi:hypothetical protein